MSRADRQFAAIFGITISIAAVFAAAYLLLHFQPQLQSEPDRVYSTMSAEALCGRFLLDERRALGDYGEARIAVQGEVAEITVELLGAPAVILDGQKGGLIDVQARFSAEREKEIRRLRVGQQVVIEGEVGERVGNFVVLRDCRVR